MLQVLHLRRILAMDDRVRPPARPAFLAVLTSISVSIIDCESEAELQASVQGLLLPDALVAARQVLGKEDVRRHLDLVDGGPIRLVAGDGRLSVVRAAGVALVVRADLASGGVEVVVVQIRDACRGFVWSASVAGSWWCSGDSLKTDR